MKVYGLFQIIDGDNFSHSEESLIELFMNRKTAEVSKEKLLDENPWFFYTISEIKVNTD
jgi:hypothetical protein